MDHIELKLANVKRMSCILWLWILGSFTTACFSAINEPSQIWEKEIAAFEAMDRTNPPPKHAILFVGSSSIRMWRNLAQDMPGLTVVRRGFGGSQIVDSTAYANRIMTPYQPRIIVLYAGDNDIAAGKSAAQILADFKALVAKVHTTLPQTSVVFLAIKPSIARWKWVETIRQANHLIQDYTRTNPSVHYIDVFSPLLDTNGKPKANLFEKDGLHLNRQGYLSWAEIIRPRLLQLNQSLQPN